MHVVVKPRQASKTHDLLLMAQETFSYIVCPSQSDVNRLWRRAVEMELNIPQPITWHELVNGRYRSLGIKGFIIDDLDRCIQSMTMVPIKAVSLNDSLELDVP